MTAATAVAGDPPLIVRVTLRDRRAAVTVRSDAPAATAALTGAGRVRTLVVTPVAVGIARVAVRVDGAEAAHLEVGVSARTPALRDVVYGIGSADPSAAIALDVEWMLVADDEDDVIRLHSRTRTGAPAAVFPLAVATAPGDESDIEAAARDGGTVYWLGSASTRHDGTPDPDRDVLVTTALSGTGAATRLRTIGVTRGLLRPALAAAPGAPAELRAAAADRGRRDPDTSTGCNIEGFEIGPDGDGLLGFRSPLAGGVGGRAIVLPVGNLGGWAAGAAPELGEAILLDLAGRGIRDLRRNPATGAYLLTAGHPDDDPRTSWALYRWDGRSDAVELLAEPPAETGAVDGQEVGSWEAIVEVPDDLGPGAVVPVLTDNGTTVFYGDGVPAKRLPRALRKFRGQSVTVGSGLRG